MGSRKVTNAGARSRENPLIKKGKADLSALEERLSCLRKCPTDPAVPPGGWIRTIREALGLTNVQLAERLGRVPQSIEDVQKSELAGSIKIHSLNTLAEALGCRLVYAIVPPKPLREMREERALMIAQELMQTIKSIDGRPAKKGARKQLERLVGEILAKNPKMLWK